MLFRWVMRSMLILPPLPAGRAAPPDCAAGAAGLAGAAAGAAGLAAGAAIGTAPTGGPATGAAIGIAIADSLVPAFGKAVSGILLRSVFQAPVTLPDASTSATHVRDCLSASRTPNASDLI